jgi:hypothetical protein
MGSDRERVTEIARQFLPPDVAERWLSLLRPAAALGPAAARAPGTGSAPARHRRPRHHDLGRRRTLYWLARRDALSPDPTTFTWQCC